MSDRERVVLVGPDGRPSGTADKATVHTTDTPLHFAFSCHVVDADGNVLITRRALAKKTWPGVWTNSFCGHPMPGEDTASAIRRRAQFELGLDAEGLELSEVLPDFSYRAVDVTGIVEWEICPVYVLRVPAGISLSPNPDEVADHAWVSAGDLIRTAQTTPALLSPWSVKQLIDARLHAHLT